MLVAEVLRPACARRRPSGCPRRSRGSARPNGPARRSRCASRDGPRGMLLAPGRCPVANSSLPRTSTIVTPSSISSLTSAGSTSSIWLLTRRRSSAPEGSSQTPKPRSGFMDFIKCSAVGGAFEAPPTPPSMRSVGGSPTRPRYPPSRSRAPGRARAPGASARAGPWRAAPRGPHRPRRAASPGGFDGAALPASRPADFTLSDQNGRSVSLALPRRVVVLAFMYPSCGATCVLIAQQIRGALDELAAAGAGADRQRRPGEPARPRACGASWASVARRARCYLTGPPSSCARSGAPTPSRRRAPGGDVDQAIGCGCSTAPAASASSSSRTALARRRWRTTSASSRAKAADTLARR